MAENFISSQNSTGITNSSDLELRMAKLVGLEESQESDEEDLNNLNQPISEPQEIETEQSLSSNPFAKVGLVGTATFIMILFAGGFLSQIMSGSKNKPAKINHTLASETPSKLEPDQNQQQEIETLKTKLALTEQASAIKAAQQSLRSEKYPQIAVKPNTQVETPNYISTHVSQPLPPRIVTVERVIKETKPVMENRVTPPTKPVPFVTPVINKPFLPITPIPDPMDIWGKLAKLGSYGEVSTTEETASNPIESVTNNTSLSHPIINSNVNQNQISQENPKSLMIGSSAKAVLATAIYGETTNKDSKDNNNIFIVQLTQSLKTGDNASVALPAKTQLLTKIHSISEQGIVQLDVIKVILQENGKSIEKSVPQDALLIRASQGQPLIADHFPNHGSSVAWNNMKLFLLGGVGKAAELINRTDSQFSYQGGSTIITQNNSRGNLGAGLLEGGVKTVIPEITRQTQEETYRNAQKSDIWFLPAGTQVELFVNQEIQL